MKGGAPVGTYIKAFVMTLAAVFLAYAFTSVGVTALGLDPETNLLDDYGDLMLEARGLFLERSDDFQTLTQAILGETSLSLVRRADGTSAARLNGELTETRNALETLGFSDAAALTEAADLLCLGAEVNIEGSDGETIVQAPACVYSAAVIGDEVWFITGYHPQGCVGVAYAPDGDVAGYHSIELVEDWRIFYEINE